MLAVTLSSGFPAVVGSRTGVEGAAGGDTTVKVCAFDIPPPGVGLNTVMLNVPAVVRSLARIVAVTCVELTKLVVRFEPANCTTDVDTKFVPFTVSVNVAPTILFVGEMLVVVGRGLITVKVWALDVPPPAGLNTVMLNVPAVVRSVAGIEAVN